MNRSTKSKQSSTSNNFLLVKQETVDENVKVNYIEPTAHESSSGAPCQSVLKCEYDPDCGCKQCRFNENGTSGALQQIKLENEFSHNCVKDEVCDEEDCGCAECRSVVLSRQKLKKEQIKTETIIENRQSAQLPTNDEEITNEYSDKTKTYFRRSARVVNKPKITYTYRNEFSESDESDYEPSDEESGRDIDEDTELEDIADIVENISRSTGQKSKQPQKPLGKKSNKKFKPSHSIENKSSEDSTDEEEDVEVKRKKTRQIPPMKVLILHLNCSVCDKPFKEIPSLSKHLKDRHKILKIRCLVGGCSASFSSQKDVCRHQRSAHRGLINRWPCEHCPSKKFQSYKSLSTHVRKEHQKGRFGCPYKGCRFESNTNRLSVMNHIRWEHSEDTGHSFKIIILQLNCPECNETFKDRTRLNFHFKNRHKILHQRCCVKSCSASFDVPQDLRSHLLTKHKDLTNNWPCEHCNLEIFKDHNNLIEHVWRMHQKGHFKCAYNGCQFESKTTRSFVYNHYRTKHNEATFVCQVEGCRKIFKNKDGLKYHAQVHTGKKLFKCEHCESSYTSKSAWKTHLTNVHHIGKMFQYKCTWPKCKFVTNTRANAWVHIKNMHVKTGAKRNPGEFISKEELTVKPIDKKIEMAKKCVKNEVVNETARDCVCDECVFALLSKQTDQKHIQPENAQSIRRNEQIINQDLDYVNDCPTPDYLPSFFSEDEEEEDDDEDDEDDEVNHSYSRRSARIVNKSKIAYHEEYFENQSGSDYEPSDDEGGGGDVDEDTEVESDAETFLYNSSSKKKSKQFQEKPNKKSKQSPSKNNRSGANNSDTEDEDVNQSGQKLSANGFPLKILTLQLNCSVCDKTFDDFHLLDKHLKDRHDILKIRCLVGGCSASFSYQKDAGRHQRSAHRELINKWPCEQCHSKKFKSYKGLSSHVWKEHQTGRFRCAHEGCQFESNTNRLSVENHIRLKHLKNKFACKVEGCEMAFPDLSKLNRHSNVHTREKPYKCEHCVASYTNEQNLKHHLAKVHQVGKLNHFKCEWLNCEYVASTRGHAVRHIREVHFKKDKQRDPKEFISQTESIQNPSKDKPKEVIIIRLNCPEDDCSDHFPDKTQLTDHLSKCHRIEKFRCMQRGCLASFVNKTQFSAHRAEIHENLKEWHCHKCEYKGKTHKHLSTHVSIVHEEGVFVCGIDGCRFVSRTNSTAVANHRSIEHKQLKK